MIQGVAAKWSFSSLSAIKGVNQQVMRFAPFSTPKNQALTNSPSLPPQKIQQERRSPSCLHASTLLGLSVKA